MDEALRALEHRFRTSGTLEDEAAWLAVVARGAGPDAPPAQLRLDKLAGAWPPPLEPWSEAEAALAEFAPKASDQERQVALALLRQPEPWTAEQDLPLLIRPPRPRNPERNSAVDRAIDRQRYSQQSFDVRSRLEVAATRGTPRPGHLLRLACFSGDLRRWRDDSQLRERLSRCDRPLRELCAHDIEAFAQACAQAGIDDEAPLRIAFRSSNAFSCREWRVAAAHRRRPAPLVWLLRDGLKETSGSQRSEIEWELSKILPHLSDPPTPLLEILCELALGSAKRVRAMAQDNLGDGPRVVALMEQALAEGKASARAAAARWLGARTGHTSTLRAALAREKAKTVRKALEEALEASE